jgi:hypothetical protein
MESQAKKNKVLKSFDESREYDVVLELWCKIKRLNNNLADVYRLELNNVNMRLAQK